MIFFFSNICKTCSVTPTVMNPITKMEIAHTAGIVFLSKKIIFKITISLWKNFRYHFLYFLIRNPITDMNASVSSLSRQIVCKQVNFPKLWDLKLRLFDIRVVQVLNINELLTYFRLFIKSQWYVYVYRKWSVELI